MTTDSLLALTESVQSSPALQGTLVALSTFILEDPTTIGSGLLVADGRMGFLTALTGLTLGIAIGDLGLYVIGRFVGPKCRDWGLVSEERLKQAEDWMRQNLAGALIASRFVPGTRIPTYVGAGILRVSMARFFVLALGASLIWSALLLFLTMHLGRALMPLLGEFRWPIAGLVLVAFGGWQLRAARKTRRAKALEGPPPVSHFEFWPPYLFYIPVVFYYIVLAIKYRSLTLPTCVNPSIYSGGMIRESKFQILSLVPEEFRNHLPVTTTFRKPAGGQDGARLLAEAQKTLSEAAITFPFVAKPDEGQRGAGVQLIHDERALARYLGQFPAGLPIVFQEFVDVANEAGILYYRKPGRRRGRILSVTLKAFPSVTGDGEHTLRELILADARARIVKQVYFTRHANHLERVLTRGEVFPLVFSGNHCQGTIFLNGAHLVTPALSRRIHELAMAIPEFYFGRFDIRFQDIESFQRGENFRIVEINGAGAESTHIWDARTRLGEAYCAIFKQFRLLFEIGHLNRGRGVKPLGPWVFSKDVLTYYQRSKSYPPTS
ncbi:VTT domain-containing protein [Candidatus Poribacteria bacterium]|nr:VTT domain-containing protein [Candidatus Poribacteria bacterium]